MSQICYTTWPSSTFIKNIHFSILITTLSFNPQSLFSSFLNLSINVIFSYITVSDENLDANYVENLITEELNVCQLAADKSPNNYHSWNHRMWFISKLKDIQKLFNISKVYIKEYEFSENWTSKHISDFSCFHYRHFCIKNIFTLDSYESWRHFNDYINVDFRKTLVKLISSSFPDDSTLNENILCSYSDDNLINLLLSHSYKSCKCDVNNFIVCKKIEILFCELMVNDELLRYYNKHETLWYHRRFIIHEILSVIYEYFGLIRHNGVLVKDTCRKCKTNILVEKQAKIVRYDSNRIYSSNLFKVLLNHEKEFVEEMRNIGDNYSDRHEKYLKYVEGINN